jgi:hypothetical protein
MQLWIIHSRPYVKMATTSSKPPANQSDVDEIVALEKLDLSKEGDQHHEDMDKPESE